jgi:hypothetical protein
MRERGREGGWRAKVDKGERAESQPKDEGEGRRGGRETKKRQMIRGS